MKAQAHWLFSTPITLFESGWSDDDNKKLAQLLLNIEKREKKDDDFQYSMSGKNGYHTKNDLLTRDDVILKKFKNMIVEKLNEHSLMVVGQELPDDTQIECWGMIYRDGDYSATHQHPLADLSGVYYLKVPELKKNEGEIVLLDPRPNGRFANFGGWDNEIVVPPVVGNGVLFPSWLEHYVRPHYDKNSERIAIAFNIFLPTQLGKKSTTIKKR